MFNVSLMLLLNYFTESSWSDYLAGLFLLDISNTGVIAELYYHQKDQSSTSIIISFDPVTNEERSHNFPVHSIEDKYSAPNLPWRFEHLASFVIEEE